MPRFAWLDDGLRRIAWPLALAMAGVVLILDLSDWWLPHEWMVDTGYTGVLLLGLWFSRRRQIPLLVAICWGLLIAGAALHAQDRPLAIELLNRLGVVCMTGAIGLLIWLRLAGERIRQTAEERINEALQRLQRQTDALNEHAIVAITDPKGRITFVNDKFCQISGYRRDELLGEDHRVINSGMHSKAFFADLWNTIQAGRIWHGELCNRAKNGSLYWVDTTIVPFRDPAGGIESYVAIRNDITVRKQYEQTLAEERGRLQRYLDAAPVFIRAVNREGRVTLINNKGADILGCPPEFALGRVFYEDFVPERVRPHVRALFEKLLAGESVPYQEMPLLTARGEERWMAWHHTVSRDADGGITEIISAGEDITDRRRAQNLASLGEFSAHIAHEIKNPLAGIQNVIDIFFDSLPEQDERLDLLREVRAQTVKMNRMIADLLTFARYAAPDKVRYNLISLIQEVLSSANLDPAMQRMTVAVDCAIEEPPVWVDPAMISQVFQNIALNAAYTLAEQGRGDGRLEIRVTRQGGAYCLEFQDNGPGIPEAVRGRIFEPFFTTRSRGTGLGLAICRKVVEMHGGTIRAAGELGRGANFVVTLPVGE